MRRLLITFISARPVKLPINRVIYLFNDQAARGGKAGGRGGRLGYLESNQRWVPNVLPSEISDRIASQ